MRFPSFLLATACLVTTFSTFSATAQTATPDTAPNGQRMERLAQVRAELQKRFAAADANGDGKLTRDEAKGKMPRVEKNFDAIDTAHTGAVTLADIEAFALAQRGQRGAAK